MKTAIVVGGTTGIGQGVAKILLANNYKVGITGIEKNVIEEIQSSIQNNYKALYLNCVTDNVSEKIAEFATSLGGLDLLVLSAGIGNLNKDLGYEVENNANKVNVLAFTEIADWSYRFFKQQEYGHFAAVTSISGLLGSRVAPAYHAAKAYQISYLQGLRQKAKQDRKKGKKLYITDIRPGFVDTAMTKGKKMIWVATQDKAAKQIYSLIANKYCYGYITKRWRLVAVLIKFLPTWVRNSL